MRWSWQPRRVGLKERQLANILLDRQKKVLDVAGLVERGEKLSDAEVRRRFEENVFPFIVDLASGQFIDDPDPASYDQRKARRDPEKSRRAPANAAKIVRIPNRALVYQVIRNDDLKSLIIPVEGMGLWSTLYGYLALEPDTTTIRGITFYDHGETPGLGGEVDNPRWKSLWPGRKAYDESWAPAIKVIKGVAGPVDEDPHRVDGLSGATITSRGVSALVRFWLGPNGFGPFLAGVRSQTQSPQGG